MTRRVVLLYYEGFGGNVGGLSTYSGKKNLGLACSRWNGCVWGIIVGLKVIIIGLEMYG